jgi:ribonuclease BN (tRNA processing enzyme)
LERLRVELDGGKLTEERNFECARSESQRLIIEITNEYAWNEALQHFGLTKIENNFEKNTNEDIEFIKLLENKKEKFNSMYTLVHHGKWDKLENLDIRSSEFDHSKYNGQRVKFLEQDQERINNLSKLFHKRKKIRLMIKEIKGRHKRKMFKKEINFQEIQNDVQN